MIRKIQLYFLFLLFTCYGLDAAQMHAYLVCDTEASNIGYSVGENLENLRRELYLASNYTGLELVEHIYSEKEATSQFLKDMKKLKVDRNDVVIFYWAGHGYRTESKDNPWPSFSFANEWKGVDLNYVSQLLISKRPRLLLSWADTCNSYLPEYAAPPLAHKTHFAAADIPAEVVKANYEALFLDSEGAYIASSSIPGQYSWYKIVGGGYFTNSLIASLQHEVHRMEGTDWSYVLERARCDESFDYLPEIQTPQYQHLTFRR